VDQPSKLIFTVSPAPLTLSVVALNRTATGPFAGVCAVVGIEMATKPHRIRTTVNLIALSRIKPPLNCKQKRGPSIAAFSPISILRLFFAGERPN
jgi:hypothetical protein